GRGGRAGETTPAQEKCDAGRRGPPPAVGLPAALEIRQALVAERPAELEEKPRLADPRLADQGDEPALPLERVLPAGPQHRQLVFPPHEGPRLAAEAEARLVVGEEPASATRRRRAVVRLLEVEPAAEEGAGGPADEDGG